MMNQIALGGNHFYTSSAFQQLKNQERNDNSSFLSLHPDEALVLLWLLHLFFMRIHSSLIQYMKGWITNSECIWGAAVLYYSSTKVKLEHPAGNGLFSYEVRSNLNSAAFFSYFLGKQEVTKR